MNAPAICPDELDVELPMDGTRQKCGAIFVIGGSAVIWIAVGAVIALVFQ